MQPLLGVPELVTCCTASHLLPFPFMLNVHCHHLPHTQLAIAAKAAAAPEAPTGKPGKTTGGTNQPKPKPERKRKPPTAPAALDPNNGSPAGKRPRKATPKAQLLEVLRQEQEAWAALKAEMDAAQAAEEQEQEEKEGMQVCLSVCFLPASGPVLLHTTAQVCADIMYDCCHCHSCNTAV